MAIPTQSDLSAALRAAFLLYPDSGALNNDGLTAYCDALAYALFSAMPAIVGKTSEGGFTTTLVNKTGSPTVKGSLVSAHATVDGAFRTETNEYDTIGIVYDNGIADGYPCRIVTSGVAEVLLVDGESATRGYWVKAAPTDGRATMAAQPPGAGINENNEHFREIGHCIENKSSGTSVLAKCIVHFN